MPLTCIDSASIYAVAHFLLFDSPDDLDAWTMSAARETTTQLLINTSLVKISSPETKLPPFGQYGDIRKELAGCILDSTDLAQWHERAMRNTLTWTGRMSLRIRRELDSALASDECVSWLAHDKIRIWEHHRQTSAGLFNKAFLNVIGVTLDISATDAARLHRLSGDLAAVRAYVGRSVLREDFAVIERAYVLSAIYRGVYQDYVARLSNSSVLQHPLRRNDAFYPDVVRKSRLRAPVPNTVSLLSDIILWASRTEREKQRVSAFAKYVALMRSGVLSGEIDVSAKSTFNVARDSAIRSAKQLGIRTRGHAFYKSMDLILSLGSGAITAFVLSPFEGFMFGGASYALAEKFEIGQRIGRMFDTERRLRLMIEESAGRMNSTWGKHST
jgi:hypothetical protein